MSEFWFSVEFHSDVEDVVTFQEVMDADRKYFWRAH